MALMKRVLDSSNVPELASILIESDILVLLVDCDLAALYL